MEKISIRKYAILVGVSHTAVSKAVKVGHIVGGWDSVARKINVETANIEWGNEVKGKSSTKEKDATQPGGINAFSKSHLTESDYNAIDENITISEARRRNEIYKAEISRVTTLKTIGLYVEKEKVYHELFRFGVQIRNALQAIPDRHIDNILASDSRALAHQILLNAIHEVLGKLSDLPKM